jgi:hypothetical protein
VCLCGAKWGVSRGIRGGFAGRYAAVGRILKRAGWARLALTAAWNTDAPKRGGWVRLVLTAAWNAYAHHRASLIGP